MTDSAGVKVAGATGTNGFCLSALSDSGKYFAYNSVTGGLRAGSFASAALACP